MYIVYYDRLRALSFFYSNRNLLIARFNGRKLSISAFYKKRKRKKKQTAGQKVDPCRLGEAYNKIKKKHINYPHYIFVHMDVYKLFIKFGNAKRLRIFNFKKIQYDTLLSSKYIYFCSHGSVPLFSLFFSWFQP
jgi:hypothetical protein